MMTPLAKSILLSVCLGLVDEYQEYSLTQTQELVRKLVADHEVYIPTCLLSIDSEIPTPTNLLGIEIPVALAEFPPFLEVVSGKDDPTEDIRGKGMSWELMHTLASHFNFTPVPLLAEHDLIGLKTEEGQWHGALELLHADKAEFTVLPVTYTEERQEDFEFSMLLGTTTFGILAKRPNYTPKPDALLRPFRQGVWWCILMSTAVMGPLIYFIIVVRVRLCKGDPTLTRIFPFDHCVWFVYGAMMKQGSTLKPISDSSRILFATWWLFIMIVTSFYTANLTAFLTFNGLELSIQSVKDLTYDPTISWLAYNEGALVEIINNHKKLGILRELQEEGRGEFTESRQKAIELVAEGTHVYIDDVRILKFIIQEDFKVQQKLNPQNPCRFYTAPLTIDEEFTFWYGYSFKKGSLYKDIFDRFFRRLSLFGIMDYIHLNATSNLPVCTLPKGFKERKLQTRDLITTYILAAIGYAIAGFSLIFEYFCRRRVGRKKKPGVNLPSLSKNVTIMNIGHSQKHSVPTVEWSNMDYPPAKIKKMGDEVHLKKTGYALPNALQDSSVIHGKINNVDVAWDTKNKKLVMDDLGMLRGNIVVIDGVPYVMFQYKDDTGPKVQKLIVSDLI